MRRALFITLALFAVILAAVHVRYGPPSPASRNAPRERFSAERAREVQAGLVGDGATRWVGTEGNARARGFISSELEKLGWTVETQRAMSCTFHGMCASVTNVVGRLPGREPSLPGVLISAHYDSVPVSPGASDDGLGTATVLETARALAEGPRPRRSVVALLVDGEEAGLLGSDAFVRNHPLARTVRTTVNVDARGSHGPSQMFETSRGNDWLVSLMASHLERPVTSSLYYEAYKRMPNDTDFTVTKTIASGLNFANIAGIEEYHTPLDALNVSDLGTLQHHGDHVLGMTRVFAEADASAFGSASNGPTDDVWFDVLALGIVHWPERWTVLIALVSLALVMGQSIRARAFDRGIVVFFAIVPGALVALAAGVLLRAAGALPAFWVAHPVFALASVHSAAAAAVLGTVFVLAAKSTPRALWAGTWIGWGALGAGAATVAPGTSYLFIVPTAFAAVCAWLPFEIACVLPAGVAATLVLALAPGIYDALGFIVVPLLALPSLLLGTTLAPMLVGFPRSIARGVPGALGALAIVSAILAAVVPTFSATNPQRVNVAFRQDTKDKTEGATARVFVDTTWGAATWGAPPPAMLSAIGGALDRERALPWTMPTPFANTPPIDARPPVVETGSVSDVDGRRRVGARIRSQRGASTVALFFPSGRRVEVKVEGRHAMPRSVSNGSVVGLLAVPSEGVAVEIEAPGAGEPIAITLLDRSPGVPSGTKASDAVTARPKEAAPFQDGDVTVLTWTGAI